MDKVKHPQWQCPGCKTVIHHAGAPSHMNSCDLYSAAALKKFSR